MIRLGPLFIILAALMWAFDGVLRRSLFSLAPIIIVFYEHFLGAIILLPSSLKAILKTKITKNQWLAFIWVSILSGVLGTLWFTTALVKTEFIPFSVVFLLQKLQPLFAIIAARLLLKESLPKNYLLWAGLAIVAAFFVTFPNGSINFTNNSQQITAALFSIGAAFAWGSSTAFSRYLLLKLSHTVVTGMRFLLTTLFAIPLVFILNSQSQLTAIDGSQWIRLIMITCSTGLFALWIYYQGLKRTPAKVSTILELTFPVTAVFIDIVLYKSVLVPSQYLSAIILMAAIFFVSRQTSNPAS